MVGSNRAPTVLPGTAGSEHASPISALLTEPRNRRSRTLLYCCSKKGRRERQRIARHIGDGSSKSAMIEFEGGAFSCAVRNLSDTGAALDVPACVGIPHEFKLRIETDRVTRHCRVVWRREIRIGVAFDHIRSA